MIDNWISVEDNLPKEIGWYKIKTLYGEFEAPFVNNGNGDLVWVLLDVSIITHWKNKRDYEYIANTKLVSDCWVVDVNPNPSLE